jgi:hypothetical protein
MSHRQAALAAAVASLVASTAAIGSCGSAFCMVNTNWGVQGVWNEPGFRGDVRFEYIDQDQPRTGTRNVGVGEIPRDHDEVRTLNRNVFATLDYGISAALGVSVILPWVDREHEHVHNGDDGPEPESWRFSGLGDMRVVGRYQFSPTTNDPQATRVGFAGVTGGLKLPTGRTTVANGEGEVAERTLQPGTGTTDALLGAYYREALGSIDASWFAQFNLQFPLDSYHAFRPGRQVLIDVGGRWDATDKLGLMLQLNALWKARDSGAQAEPDDSGSRTVSLSPGFTYALTPTIQVYAFLQVPVYQHVNGVQLVADRSYAVGVSAQF